MLGLIILTITGAINGYLVRCFVVQQRQGDDAWLYNPPIYSKYGTVLAGASYVPAFWVFWASYRSGHLLEAVGLWLVVSYITYAYLGKRWRRDRPMQ